MAESISKNDSGTKNLLPSFPAPNKFFAEPHETSPKLAQNSYAQMAKLSGLLKNAQASPMIADYEDIMQA